MWSVWIHAEKQQQVHRQGSNTTDHRNQRASECAKPSIHYRASLSPSALALWSSVLLAICFDFSLFISCTEDSTFFLMFHINILSRKNHVLSKLTQHRLGWCFWMQKKQHRSLLAQANGVYTLLIFSNALLCRLFLRDWKYPSEDMATRATCPATFI